mgnify:CR=1 FL=1
MPDQDAPIRLVSDQGIAEIILDVPDRRNALSDAMWAAIPGLVARAVAETETRVILLHGGAAGAFAAGADISEFESIYADEASARRAANNVSQALEALETCPKPVIAAIEGACVGGGVSLAIACDLRVAAEGARFGVTPARLGLVYPLADTRRLVETVGGAAARDILLTGRIFPAEEAFRLRLVDRLVERGGAVSAARSLGRDIGALSQFAVRGMKQSILKVEAGQRDEDGASRAEFVDGALGEDFREGYRAFLEKRPPRFPWRG